MPLPPEHRFQIGACKLIRGCVIAPACWTSVDRRKKSSALSHIHEHARGIKAGVSDIFLAQSRIWGWIELKDRGGQPSDHQLDWEIETTSAGGFWFVSDTFAGIVQGLRRAGIALHPNADVLAMQLEALRDAGDAKRAAATGGKVRKAKGMRDKPTQGQLRKVAALRQRLPF
jgi:hypothetical protein